MATFSGSTIGATGGAAVGGIGGAATGAVLGYGSGIVYDWATTEENQQTVTDLGNLSKGDIAAIVADHMTCLLYTSPSPRDCRLSRMPSSA